MITRLSLTPLFFGEICIEKVVDFKDCIPEISEALTHRDGVLEEVGREEVEDKVVPVMRGPVTTEEPGQVINLNLLDEDQ